MGVETWNLSAKLCDSCKSTPATLFCCSDSAFLCMDCYFRNHTANKLASLHARVRVCEYLKMGSPNPSSYILSNEQVDSVTYSDEQKSLEKIKNILLDEVQQDEVFRGPFLVPEEKVFWASSSSTETGNTTAELLENYEVDNYFPSTTLAISLNSNEQAGNTFSYHDEEEYLNSFPLGYRFNPTDEELIRYLQKKINNQKMPPNRIKVVELYNFDTPEDLITRNHSFTREDKYYFFTKNNRKGRRSSRMTPGGSWIPTIADDPIHNKGMVIGFKKTLCFHKGLGKRNEKAKTNWIMHEYSIANKGDTTCDGLKPEDDWVLCSIYKRPEPKNKRLGFK